MYDQSREGQQAEKAGESHTQTKAHDVHQDHGNPHKGHSHTAPEAEYEHHKHCEQGEHQVVRDPRGLAGQGYKGVHQCEALNDPYFFRVGPGHKEIKM